MRYNESTRERTPASQLRTECQSKSMQHFVKLILLTLTKILPGEELWLRPLALACVIPRIANWTLGKGASTSSRISQFPQSTHSGLPRMAAKRRLNDTWRFETITQTCISNTLTGWSVQQKRHDRALSCNDIPTGQSPNASSPFPLLFQMQD